MGPRNRAETALRVRTDRHLHLFGERMRHVIERHELEAVSVVQAHGAEIRTADARRILQHLLEYRLQFTRR